MSQPPPRLRDENPNIARLIDALDRQRPDPNLVSKIHALPERVPVPAAPPGAGRALSSMTPWLVAGACALALGGFGWAARDARSTRAPSSAPAAAPVIAANATAPTEAPPSEAASAPVRTLTVGDLPNVAAPDSPTRLGASSSDSRVVAVTPRSRITSTISTTPPSAGPTASTFHEELELVESARSALSRGDGQAALDTLDRYDARFQSGALFAEAAITRIEALASLGRIDAARAAAQGFLTRDAAGPYAARVRSILDRLSSPSSRESGDSSDTDRKGSHR